jgi:predicted GNAT family acetyltransferase
LIHVEGGRIFLDPTYTPTGFGGKGVGGRLLSAAKEYARSNHHSIVPVCPFAIEYFKKHPEYGEVVEKGV